MGDQPEAMVPSKYVTPPPVAGVGTERLELSCLHHMVLANWFQTHSEKQEERDGNGEVTHLWWVLTGLKDHT